MDSSLGPGPLAGFEPLTLGRFSAAHRGTVSTSPGSFATMLKNPDGVKSHMVRPPSALGRACPKPHRSAPTRSGVEVRTYALPDEVPKPGRFLERDSGQAG